MKRATGCKLGQRRSEAKRSADNDDWRNFGLQGTTCMQPNIIGNNLASGLALFAISRAYKISWYRSRQPAIKIPILLYGQIDRSVEGLVKQRSPRPSPATYNDRHKGRTDHADAETSNLDKGDREREKK